jgi:thioredoxin reductase
VALSQEPGTQVTLSYRGEAFSRIKTKNRQLLDQQREAGRLQVLLGSVVKSIEARSVRIEHEGRERSLRNDAVIVCAGGQLPTELLRKVGIRFDTKFGTA